MRLLPIPAALLLAPALFAQAPAGPTIPKLADANPEMVAIVVQDQWDRGNDMFGANHRTSEDKIDWDAAGKRDRERQAAVRKLIAAGSLTTGKDYRFAALVGALSDAERALWCVIPLAEQEKVYQDFRDGKPLRGTSLRDCK